MPVDYIPPRDIEFKNWSQNFSDRINSDPAGFGVTPVMAAQYQTLNDAYAVALQTAYANSTRTPSAITAKNDARRALESNARQLAAIIQATPGVTAAQKGMLGLTIRKTTKTPVSRPSSPPVLSILGTQGRVVRLRIRDLDSPASRGRPKNAAGAALMMWAGDGPAPDSALEWSFVGNITTPLHDVRVPWPVPAGSRVSFAAMWFNRRGERGPASATRTTYVGEGVAIAA